MVGHIPGLWSDPWRDGASVVRLDKVLLKVKFLVWVLLAVLSLCFYSPDIHELWSYQECK